MAGDTIAGVLGDIVVDVEAGEHHAQEDQRNRRGQPRQLFLQSCRHPQLRNQFRKRADQAADQKRLDAVDHDRRFRCGLLAHLLVFPARDIHEKRPSFLCSYVPYFFRICSHLCGTR